MTAGRGPVSAALLLYREDARGALEVLICHPGGPFFRRRDAGAWTLPKGEPEPGEELAAAALRELREETGLAPGGPLAPLGDVVQKSGKRVHAFAARGDLPAGYTLESNTFTMEWPRGSGRVAEFPEIDRVEFVPPAIARQKLNPAQAVFVDRLEELLGRTERP